MKSVAFVLMIVLLAAASAWGQAFDPDAPLKAHAAWAPMAVASLASDNFDATYYHLDVAVRFAPDEVAGCTRVVGRAKGTPLETLRLDFHRAMRVDSVQTTGGDAPTFVHDADVLAIDLPAAVPVGEPVDVRVCYAGMPEPTGFGGFVFDETSAGAPVAWTLSEPYGARHWWPSKDHPSDKADSVRITVTVPHGLRVGANGLLVTETHTATTSTYDWRSRYPIATYLVSIAAADYVVDMQTYQRPDSLAATLGGLALPILNYVYPSSAEALLPGWQHAPDVFPVLEWWFGAYPFADEKYGHAQFTRGGGMEHQTMSSMGGASLDLVVHELGHQWYGDLLTNATWDDLWLNEGFATYSQALYWQSRTDTPAFWDTFRTRMHLRARSAQGVLARPDTTDIGRLFAPVLVYNKGAAVLHMLRWVLGDATFREVLQSYAADPALRFGNVTSADFQRVAETVSGVKLDYFFEQWLYRAGYPTYEVAWRAEGDETVVEVTQTQAEAVFEMPLPLVVRTDAETRSFVVFNDQRTQTFTLPVADPTGVLFDPDEWLLRNADVPSSSVSVERQLWADAVLHLPAPNPVGARGTVAFTLPAAGAVELSVWDVAGRQVRRLVEDIRAAGTHRVGLSLDGLPAGTYVLRLRHTDGVLTRRFVHL